MCIQIIRETSKCTREMQIKTTMRYFCLLIRMAKIKYPENTKYLRGKRTNWNIAGGNEKWASYAGKIGFWRFWHFKIS